jgi:hypothetical protein
MAKIAGSEFLWYAVKRPWPRLPIVPWFTHGPDEDRLRP